MSEDAPVFENASHLQSYLKSLESVGIKHVVLNLRFNQADIETTLKRLADEQRLLMNLQRLPVSTSITTSDSSLCPMQMRSILKNAIQTLLASSQTLRAAANGLAQLRANASDHVSLCEGLAGLEDCTGR